MTHLIFNPTPDHWFVIILLSSLFVVAFILVKKRRKTAVNSGDANHFSLGLGLAIFWMIVTINLEFEMVPVHYTMSLEIEEEVFEIPVTVHKEKTRPAPPVPKVNMEIETVPEEIVAIEERVDLIPLEVPKDDQASQTIDRPAKPMLAPSMPKPKRDDTPKIMVEFMPYLLNCGDDMSLEEKYGCSQTTVFDFFHKNVKYPAKAKSLSIEGTVVLQFVIDDQGQSIRPVIRHDIGGGCAEEVLRVYHDFVRQYPHWRAGRQGLETVPVYFTVPVKFKLK